ncbi:MAG: NAD(P)/FAD-dependent oxidoreductase [Actinomycetota bacterium]
MKVLLLGAGFGGLEIASALAEELGDEVEVTLIDRAEGFVFGFSKLDVMFGRTTADAVLHRYADIVKPGVRFVQAEIRAIDPEARRVVTDAGEFAADIMVVALGAEVDPAATPGLVEGGTEFYTNAGAFAARAVLERFPCGRVIVGVMGSPFKCPPAPSETALLVHDLLEARDLGAASSVALVMPLPRPIPPSPDASEALLTAFAERGIDFHPNTVVASLDPARKVAVTADGEELPYDLFLAVPKHRVPQVVEDSGLCVDGLVPVDPYTLETRFPGVYAVGDVTSVGTPKAGVFSEGQAVIVGRRIIDTIRGRESEARYDGAAACYLEFGEDEVARVDIVFAPGQPPHGVLSGPSAELVADKHAFGRDRIRRWFGRDWTAY